MLKFGETERDAAEPLDRWYRIAKRAVWANFAELRADFPPADLARSWTIFNIGGNKLRLVAEIDYARQKLLIRGAYTHEEYDELDF